MIELSQISTPQLYLFQYTLSKPKQSSDTTILFLTVKNNVISTQVLYNSTEDIPGLC